MKKTILIAALSALMAVPAFAQDDKQNNTPEMRAERKTDKMVRELNLRDDQRDAVYQANLRMYKATPDNTDVSTNVKTTYNNDLREVLDDDQYRRYEEWKEDKMKSGHKKDKMRKDRSDKMNNRDKTP